MNTLVSVIIPCFNAEKFIGETLESVMNQTYQEIEVIVVDDGSTDASGDILRSFQGSIRIEFLKHQGVSQARNHGIRLATGSFIQYLDADDLLTTDSLALKVKAAKENNSDVVYGYWQRLVEDKTGQFQKSEIVNRTLEDVHPDPEIATMTDFWAPPAALLYSRKIVDKIGSWNETLPVIQDARYLQDAALHKAKFSHVSQVTAYYREHRTGSLSKRNPRAFVQDCFLNATQAHGWWQEHGGITSDRKKALLQVYGYVARASFELNPELFEHAYRELISFEPGYIPPGPPVLRYLSRLIGYRRAEYVAMHYRKVKKMTSVNEKNN